MFDVFVSFVILTSGFSQENQWRAVHFHSILGKACCMTGYFPMHYKNSRIVDWILFTSLLPQTSF